MNDHRRAGVVVALVGAVGVTVALGGLSPRAHAEQSTSAASTRGARGAVSTTPRAPAGAAERWVPPRTADGQVDLQGIWVSRSATPLERPKALEGRERLTDEEVAELKRRAARIFDGSGDSDFAAGDAFFMAAWDNTARFRSPTSTHGSDEMTVRDFDNRTSLVIDPADGRIPPITPEAQRRRAAAAASGQRPAGPEDLNNALRCITWSVPRLGGRYGAGDLAFYQIVQSPGYVLITFEIGHDARIIPLDGRPHPPADVRFWNGDSRGWWEGNTLVVDTTNFSDKSNFMGAGEGLHLIERFTRVAPDTITYQLTIDDPSTWTRAWTAEMPLKATNEQLFEYACHEGNKEIMEGVLRATRADERAGR